MEIVPELNDSQMDRISEFLSNLSLVVIASLVIPNLIGVDKPNMTEVLSVSGEHSGFEE